MGRRKIEKKWGKKNTSVFCNNDVMPTVACKRLTLCLYCGARPVALSPTIFVSLSLSLCALTWLLPVWRCPLVLLCSSVSRIAIAAVHLGVFVLFLSLSPVHSHISPSVTHYCPYSLSLSYSCSFSFRLFNTVRQSSSFWAWDLLHTLERER